MTNETDTTLVDIYDEDNNYLYTLDWPYCQIEGCENRICLGVSEKFCHPHSGGKEADELIENINQSQKVAA